MATPEAIKKAFEQVLKDAVAASAYQNKVIWVWPNIDQDDSALNLKIRPHLIGPREKPMTLGPNTRVATKGIFKVGLFARPGTGTDDLDALAEIVKAAYPYSTDLDAGGAKIQIDLRELGDLLQAPDGDGWPYRALDLTWSIGI